MGSSPRTWWPTDTTCPCSTSTPVGPRRSAARPPCSTVADLAASVDITILSLPTPAVVSAVADEWVGSAPAGAVLVDLSTNDPDVVRELGERLAGSGHRLVEAPLTGGAVGAEKRSLVFMVGGDDDAVAQVLPVLEPLGRATFHVGELGLGNTIKLVNSLIAFTTAWVSLEGLSIAKKAGIDVQAAVEVLRTATGGNYFLNQQVEGIDTRGRPTQFALELAAKDAGPHRRPWRTPRHADAGRLGRASGARPGGGRRVRRRRLERPRQRGRAAARRRAPLERLTPRRLLRP